MSKGKPKSHAKRGHDAPPSPASPQPGEHEKRRADEDGAPQNWLIALIWSNKALTAIGTLAAVVLVWYTQVQIGIARRGGRAWLVPISLSKPEFQENQVTVIVVVKNTGQIPASKVVVRCLTSLHDIAFDNQNFRESAGEFIAADAEIRSACATEYTPEEIDLIKRGEATLYLRYMLRYDDGFDRRGETERCWTWSATERGPGANELHWWPYYGENCQRLE